MDIYNGMFKGYKGTYYGINRQPTFCDVFETVDSFISDYKECGIPTMISDATARTLYYLLYAQYGNSTIRSSDTNQFKYQLFSKVFAYGPAWEKKLEIQQKFINLSEDDLRVGTKAVHNTAMNPGTEPTTSTLNELDYINQQNTTNYKKGKLEAYSMLYEVVKNDVTQTFLVTFKKLFKQVVQKEQPLLYETEVTD